jgi:hypothetical protein
VGVDSRPCSTHATVHAHMPTYVYGEVGGDEGVHCKEAADAKHRQQLGTQWYTVCVCYAPSRPATIPNHNLVAPCTHLLLQGRRQRRW